MPRLSNEQPAGVRIFQASLGRILFHFIGWTIFLVFFSLLLATFGAFDFLFYQFRHLHYLEYGGGVILISVALCWMSSALALAIPSCRNLQIRQDGFSYRVGLASRSLLWSQCREIAFGSASKRNQTISFAERKPFRPGLWWFLRAPARLTIYLLCVIFEFAMIFILSALTGMVGGGGGSEWTFEDDNQIPAAFYRGSKSSSFDEIKQALEAGVRSPSARAQFEQRAVAQAPHT